ncbi:UNVERIFIED_CONTAM: hypothetical protein HDU68_001017 [Siphonaria sp. JEL0065]|nr:hypothetical protein HDU68_001017 [Siphonaria sp. JEL0065]
MNTTSIIGGGPSGLAAAISLVLFGGIRADAIRVYEPRTPIRTNVLVLSRLVVERLRSLGVAVLLSNKNQIANFETLRVLNEKPGADPTLFKAKMEGHLQVLDNVGVDSSSLYAPAPMADILYAQKVGTGIVGVAICDLEKALRDRALHLGICVIDGVVSKLEFDQNRYHLVLDDGSTDKPDLVILAEGNSRRLATHTLKIPVEACSEQEHYARVHIKSNIGSILNVGFMAVGNELAKFLITGDPAQPRYTQSIMQIREPFNLINGRHEECKTGTEPQYSFHEGSGAILKEVAHEARNAFKKLELPHEVVFSSMAPRSFVVQDTMLQTTVCENVVVIGDAAHSGHFLTGVGTAVGILFDSDILLKLIKGGSTAEFAESMRSGTKEWFAYDKAAWFSSNEVRLNKQIE